MANILCIDDEPHVASLRCLALEAAGHYAMPAWTMVDVIYLLRSHPFDVVVLGAWAGADCHAIARQARNAARPALVIITSYRRDEESYGECADLCLEQAVGPDSLVDIVRELLRGGCPKPTSGRAMP